MPTLTKRIPSFFLKLIFAVFAAIFALSLLAVVLGALVLGMFKWLITGKKPAFAMVWTGMRKSSHSLWSASAASKVAPRVSGVGEVVDVEAREVRELRADGRPL